MSDFLGSVGAAVISLIDRVDKLEARVKELERQAKKPRAKPEP